MNARVFLCVIAQLILSSAVIGCGGVPPSQPRVGQNPRVEVAKATEAPAGGEKQDAPATVISRKVIQTATVSLVVKDLDEARRELNRFIEEQGGYVSKAEFLGNRGTRRKGNWTIRVPAEKFSKFVEVVVALGIPDRLTSDAQDVTEEFVDIEARVKNLKSEEETLNRLMKELVKSNADLLTFREQLRGLREKIEIAEARLQNLGSLTSMSTLHLTMNEEQDYTPPTAPSTPTFVERIGSTFDTSLTVLQQIAERIVIGLVAIGPWVPLILGVVGIFWLSKRNSARTVSPPVATEGPVGSVPNEQNRGV